MAQEKDGFEQMMNIWQEGQEAFFKAQKEVAEGFQKSISGDRSAGFGNVFSDPMSKATAEWQNFIKSWAPFWDPGAVMSGTGQADVFRHGRDAFVAMLDPAMWTQNAPEQLRKILQSVAQGPQFADLATPQADAAEAWRETLDYQKAATDFAAVLNEAWAKTYEKYSEKFDLNDLQSGNVKAALDGWLKAANEELLETQRTPAFMDAQRRMLRASMEIKARQRDIAESWSEVYQIPTRSEVDDLTKIVHELRRELRKVKRELAAVKEAKSS